MEKTFEEKVAAVVEKTLDKSLFSRFVECEGCGNLVLKKYNHCDKCSMSYVDGKWIKDDPVELEEVVVEDDSF